MQKSDSSQTLAQSPALGRSTLKRALNPKQSIDSIGGTLSKRKAKAMRRALAAAAENGGEKTENVGTNIKNVASDETDSLAAEQLAAKAISDQIALEMAEADRVAAENTESERIAAEKAESERIAATKAEIDRLATEVAEAERIAAEKAEVDRIALEMAEAENNRVAAEKAENDRVAAEKAESERIAATKAEIDRIALEMAEAENDRVAAEKAESERVAAESERVAAEKTEYERISAKELDLENDEQTEQTLHVAVPPDVVAVKSVPSSAILEIHDEIPALPAMEKDKTVSCRCVIL